MAANNKSQPEPYLAPPIIHAIIELRFDGPISDTQREAVSKKLGQRYALYDEIVTRQFQVAVQADTIATQSSVGARISRRMNDDANEIFTVGPDTLTVEVTAPYPGWDSLFERLKKDWGTAKKVFGYRKIQRIGVRYINRIDLEDGADGIVEYEKYLNLRINLPKDFPPIGRYDLGFQFAIEDIKCGATVRSAIAEPAVPGCTSFTLDLDVFRIFEVPQQDKQVYTLLSVMRHAKNNLFETFITDAARKIFNAAL